MRSFNLKAVSDWSNEIVLPNSVWIKLYDVNGWLYSSDKWTKWGGVLAWNMLELLNWIRIVCLFDFDTPLTSVTISGWGVFKHRLRFYYATWRRPTWMKKNSDYWSELKWKKKTNLSFGHFFVFQVQKSRKFNLPCTWIFQHRSGCTEHFHGKCESHWCTGHQGYNLSSHHQWNQDGKGHTWSFPVNQ